MRQADRPRRRSILRRVRLVGPVFVIAFLISVPSRADLFATDDLRVFADFRARLEADWDSSRSDGSERADRNRLRVRVRIGAQYDPNEHVSFGVRLRTGSDDSQQSPHITIVDFDDNATGDAHANLDKWYLEGRTKRAWGWVGRNGLPFWKQNELYWDDDATPAGLAGGFKAGIGDKGSIAINAGLVSLPAGMQDFVGNMTLGQIVYSTEIGGGGLTVAVGALSMEGESETAFPAVALLESGNGSRDYEIWIASVQGKLRAGDRLLTLGADLLHNAENYPDTDPMNPGSPEQFTFDNRNETDGRVFSALYGGGEDKGGWLAGYYYAHIETLAVNNSYSQDDWVRWGSLSGQTRGSNIKGHEFRFVYNLGERTNLVARLYVVEAVNGMEDGKRFRLDLNRKL